MAAFCWLVVHQAWSVPRAVPQLVHDEGLFDYNVAQPHNAGVVNVLKRISLGEEESELPLDELARRYPL